MYTITCDGNLLYDPRVEELKVTKARLEMEVNTSGTFEFTIYPTHPLYGLIQKLKSVIEIHQDGVLIFRGRVLNDRVGLFMNKEIECEGDLAFLNDTIMRPFDYTGSVSGFLQAIITSHNAQAGADKQFTLGNVTVTDPNDFIVRSSVEYQTSWQVIDNRLLLLLGGYIRVRRRGGVNYIDYLEDSPYQTLQTIELEKNILDIIKETRSDQIITALIPLGNRLTDEAGNLTEQRLTIADVNGGLDYVHDAAAVAEYGWIFGTEIWDNVTIADNLKTRAEQELALRINLGVNITLRAVDLSMVDIDIDELRVFEYVQVTSEPHGIDQLALITKLQINLINPEQNTVSLGFGYETFTEKQISTDQAIRIIENNYVTGEQITEVRETVTILSSNITQEADAIRREVSETYVSTGAFDQYTETKRLEEELTAGALELKFTTIEQLVEHLEGDTQAQFSEIVKYIRFENGNIYLGETNNPITLVIQNDRISFMQSGAEVAYFSNNRLYVYDGQFINSLRLGNFAFLPRANGSLDFKKVG